MAINQPPLTLLNSDQADEEVRMGSKDSDDHSTIKTQNSVSLKNHSQRKMHREPRQLRDLMKASQESQNHVYRAQDMNNFSTQPLEGREKKSPIAEMAQMTFNSPGYNAMMESNPLRMSQDSNPVIPERSEINPSQPSTTKLPKSAEQSAYHKVDLKSGSVEKIPRLLPEASEEHGEPAKKYLYDVLQSNLAEIKPMGMVQGTVSQRYGKDRRNQGTLLSNQPLKRGAHGNKNILAMNQAYNLRSQKSRQQKTTSTGFLASNSNEPSSQNTLEYLHANKNKTKDPPKLHPEVSAPSFPPGFEETQMFLQRNSLGLSHS